jgi:MFS family permease
VLGNRNFLWFWLSSTLSGFGEQIGSLAIPLTAVLILKASPAQMGTLIALQTLPFALFSLPLGVWLDRRRKFPILLCSEFLFPFVLASIPIAYWLGVLSMPWLYTTSFIVGIGYLVGGSAAQVFLAHLVGREHLLDAQSKFATSDSVSRLVGPGIGGILVQWLTAPIAILVDAVGYLLSWWSLLRVRTRDALPAPTDAHPLREMIDGIKFVKKHPILWPLAWVAGFWNLLFSAYMALQVLFAAHELGLSPGVLGAAQMLGGLGVFASSMLIKPLSRKVGSGGTILIGVTGTALGWILLPCIPAALFGSSFGSALAYGGVVFIFDCSVMLYFMTYLALRVKLTPDAFLGRMVSTMRFITVSSAPVGALAGGWIAEHFGVRNGLSTIAVGGIILTIMMAFGSPLRRVRD